MILFLRSFLPRFLPRFILTTLVAMLLGGSVRAQQYPVDCRVLLLPPFSGQLTDYTNSTAKLQIQLVLQDFSKPSLEVSLRLKLKGQGLLLQNAPDFVSSQTITLLPGQPVLLSGAQLADNFNISNFEAQGTDLLALYSGQLLPSGMYEWEAVAIERFRNRVVSNTATAGFSFMLNQPPLLNHPLANAAVPWVFGQPLSFGWTPRHTSNPTLAASTLYTLLLYELPEGEPTPPDALALSAVAPYAVIETAQTNYLYGPSQLPLQPGKTYAWVVRASDLNGQAAFENNGYSQVQTFTLQGPQCPAPGQAQAVVSGQEVAFSWQGVEQATAYELSYGPTPQGPEQAVLVAEPRYLLLQQPAGQAFAFRVRSHCANGQVSPWSLPQAYQTPELPQEPAWESDPELSYTPPPDNPQATDEPAWQATDPTQADEPQPPADPVADALADALAEPIAVVMPLDTSGAAGQAGEVAVLPPNPSLEQLRAAAKKVPPTCAGITATYVCGSHDAPPSYSGESISIAAGDELAMNSLVLTVVSIDEAGNGVGTIKVPMLNGARLALRLSGIQAVKGGCIVAGRAEIDPSVPLLQLDDKLRQNLQTLSLANQLVANAGQQYAQQIADGVNATLQAIQQLGQKITEKKRNTQALLANSSTENLALVLENCTDMATQTKVLQDSLHSIICKIEAGKLKANAAKLKEAYRANIAFMNKLGPALNECNPANNFTPWSELPCKGPCDNTPSYYEVDEKCFQILGTVLGVKMLTEDEILEDITGYLEFIKAINILLSYYDQCEVNSYLPPKGGLVPHCFWKSIVVNRNLRYITDPSFTSGIIDGFYGEVVALSKIEQVITDVNSTVKGLGGYYFLNDCSKNQIAILQNKYEYYEQKYSKIAALSDNDKNLIKYFFEKIRLHQLINVRTQLLECERVEQSIEIVKSAATFFSDYANIVTATDKIMARVDDFMQKEFLNKDLDNQARYEQGRTVAQIVSMFLPMQFSKAKNATRIEQTLVAIDKNPAKFEAEIGKVFLQQAGKISQALRNKILAKLSTSQADNLIAELGTNPSLKAAMEADEILPEVWKRIDDGIPSFKTDKPTDYLTCMKKLSTYEKAKGGSGTVKYYRVQGGGSGSATSRELLEVSTDGKLTFTDKTKELYFSTDNLEHANYYITGKGTNINGEILNVSPPRAGGKIIEFEVPKWLDDKLKSETIPQYKSGSNTLNSNSPQIVDYNQPGNPFGIKTSWQTLIEQNYIVGSAKIIN